jgi:hypothetical protein
MFCGSVWIDRAGGVGLWHAKRLVLLVSNLAYVSICVCALELFIESVLPKCILLSFCVWHA